MKQVLEQWQPRGSFVRIVALENEKCSSVEIWGARQKWLREANLAAAIARASRAQRVRITDDAKGGADSEIVLRDGTLVRFQHVEADYDGRRRGDEYKAWARNGFPLRIDRSEEMERKRAEFPSAIRRVVDNKVGKKNAGKYDETISLLVHVNLGSYTLDQEALELELLESTHPASNHFKSVWAWWAAGSIAAGHRHFLEGRVHFARAGPLRREWLIIASSHQSLLLIALTGPPKDELSRRPRIARTRRRDDVSWWGAAVMQMLTSPFSPFFTGRRLG